jgi:anti-sigma B factor antagonist
MDFVCTRDAGTVGGGICRVTGEVDISNADELSDHAAEVLKAHGTPLVIDFSGVTFVDSSGLRALVAIRKHAIRRGVWDGVELRGVARRVLRMMTTTECASFYHHHPG